MNRHSKDSHEVLEPEVLPPDPGKARQRGRRQTKWVDERIRAIGMGLLLDALDLMTWGPSGWIGLLIGFTASFYLLGLMKIEMQRRILYSIGAAIYCFIPGTGRIPLGTILGAVFGLKRRL